MEHFFVGLFQTHFATWKDYGALFVFALTLLESLPVIGAFLPGQTIVIFAGFLVKLGYFDFWSISAIASIGAVLGDLFGFALGRRYGKAILKRERFLVERKHFESATRLVKENSIKSIFIGRLHSFTRTLMPFAAGMSGISARKFVVVDFISAIIWAFISLSIGYVFGKSFEAAATFVGKVVIMTTLISIIIVAAVSHMRTRGRKIASLDAVLSGVSVTFLYLFAITAQSFASGKFFRVLDVRAQAYALHFHFDWLTGFMAFWSHLGGPIFLPAISSIFILWLISKRKIFEAFFSITTLGFGVIVLNILKAYFERIRPVPEFAEAFGTSFPSGHAMMALVFAIVVYFISIRKIEKSALRISLSWLAFGSALVIGLSRVYLNVHWASDVLAGFFFGGFFASIMIIVFRLAQKVIGRARREKHLPDIP